MEIVLDSCSLINLINGSCLDQVLLVKSNNYYVGEMLFEQEILNNFQKVLLQTLIEKGEIKLVEAEILVAEITDLKTKYDLGLGETECIAVCKKCGYTICTDDLKARKCSKIEIGNSRVIGSLYLLRESVRQSVMKCIEASNFLNSMKLKGAFLPQIQREYFCED